MSSGKKYRASIKVQQEQFRKIVVANYTYSELCLCVTRLWTNDAITKSEAEKYKRWYRRMKRGEL